MRSPSRLLLLPPVLIAAACGLETGRADRPPNVLVYLVDTLRHDHLSVYGYPHETSPRLAEFARDAVRFETAYSPTSWTRPAVASLLTGLTPLRHGAIARADRLDPEVRLLPQYLHAAGYHSAAFVTNPNVLPVWGFGRGFDAFVDVEGADGAPRADEVNEAVFRHLREAAAQPFFLYVHTIDPHYPYQAPPPFGSGAPRRRPGKRGSEKARDSERSRRTDLIAAYDAEIRFSDHEFGRLIAFLQARRLYRDALIVFTSDHGEEFKEHGSTGHGHSLFEEVVRVPLLVKLPGSAHAGRVVRAPASLLDLLPTIVRLAGGDLAGDVEGVDLLELLRDEDDAGPPSRPLFLDLDAMTSSDPRLAAGVVWGRYKLLDSREPDRRVDLFDLVRDPEERGNAALREPELAEHLEGVLAEHRSGSEAGVHLWITNTDDGRTRRVQGSLRTTGRFAALRALQLERGDRIEIARDRRRLGLSLRLENRRNPFPEPPLRLVDQDRLVFTVEPPSATIEIESLTIDGAPAPIFLGDDPRPVPETVRVFDPGAPELRVERMDTIFRASREASSLAPLGAYLGVVQRTPAPDPVLDPAVEERLRALGYAE